MSVLIHGMDMPECCEVCPCYNWVEDICRITDSPNDFSDTRVSDCPIAEVPTPHGRLIDADDIDNITVVSFPNNRDPFVAGRLKKIIAPVIIESEVSKE